jgi:hypothetical protein
LMVGNRRPGQLTRSAGVYLVTTAAWTGLEQAVLRRVAVTGTSRIYRVEVYRAAGRDDQALDHGRSALTVLAEIALTADDPDSHHHAWCPQSPRPLFE